MSETRRQVVDDEEEVKKDAGTEGEDEENDFDEVYAELDGDEPAPPPGDQQPQAPADQPAPAPRPEVRREGEIIELSRLAPERRQQVDQLLELQGLIIRFVDQMRFASKEEKDAFIKRLQDEMGKEAEGGDKNKFSKLPEFGAATKEGFAKLVDFFAKGALPATLDALDQQQLQPPPDCPLRIAGRQENVLRSNEQFRQDVRQGKQYLDIDPNKLEDVRKIRGVTDWLTQSNNVLNTERVERLERYLTTKVEEGIRAGKFPAEWRRPPEMDKATWCSQVDQVMNHYTRATRVIEALNHMQRSKEGFTTDAFDNLPPGVRITRDRNTGRVTDVDFGPLLVRSLNMQSDANRQVLDPLKAWADKYEPIAQQALRERFKEQTQVAGYGEAEVPKGWVNPKTKEFVAGRDTAPGSDWVRFNMIGYDMDIQEKRDQFGQVSEVTVRTDCQFQEIPPYGYLNTLGEIKHREQGQPVTYKPDDWVAVQTGPGQVEMIQAKDLADWRARQQFKLYAGKAITFTMDAAMVVSGTIELRAAATVAQLGTREAVAIGGQVLKTELATQLPKHVISRQVAKGLFEVGLGLTGVFHNAGAHEVPWMKTVSDLRTAYFLLHAGYSVSELFRLPQAGMRLAEAVSPRVAGAARATVDTIRGSEATLNAMELAHAGALSKIWKGWYGMDKLAGVSFNLSEKAFIGMFLWDVGHAYHRSQLRPDAMRQAARALDRASLTDSSALETMMSHAVRPGETTEAYFQRYRDTLGTLSPEATKKINDIIAKVKELSAAGAKEEDKQKYVQELIQYLRYDGTKVASLQNGRQAGNELSEQTVTNQAKADSTSLDPNVRRMAALAMLALTRKPDGSWPENLTSREITVGDYTVYHPNQDGPPVAETIRNRKITQNVSSAELVEVLQSDFRAQTDSTVRANKAAALHEVGLTSSEHLGDLLLGRIENPATSKEDRLRTIIELGSLLSRLKIEEKMRDQIYTEDQKNMARGLTAGTTSADLLRRLEEFGMNSEDKDVKATALFAQLMLQRDTMDDADKKRLTDAFFKDPPGITQAKFLEHLQADANATPAATDKTGWERKILAAQMLIKLGLAENKVDDKAVTALIDCVKNGANPELAVRAFHALTAVDPQAGRSLLDSLEAAQPGSTLRNQVLTQGLNLFNEIGDKPAMTIQQRIDSAKARERLITSITPMIKANTDNLLRRQLVGHLTAMSSRTAEPIEEVRVAAIRGLAELGARDKDTIDALKRNLDFRSEPSAAVRLATVDALERLIVRARERKEVFGPLAVAEPDQTVKARLARYFRASGSIQDVGSQASDQAVADARTEQNREEIKPREVEDWLGRNVPKLTQRNNIFDYLDPNAEQILVMRGMTTLAANWQSGIDAANEGAWFPGWQARNKSGRERLFELELTAQNRAFAAYQRGVDDLVTKAMTGGTDRNVRMGDQQVSERDASVLALGALVRGGSRMGQPFYMHRNKDELDAANLSYGPFNESQQRLRERHARATGWDRRPLNLEVYTEDPWPRMEQTIARKLTDLASASKDTVNLKLVKDQLLLGLESAASTSDASRVILVQGLDRLLSRPETDPEVKRDIIRRVAKLVHDTKEVDVDKAQAMSAMVALLDKHGKRNFEQFSDDYAFVRTAIQARSQMESFRTPPGVRLRAQELFDREWQSVLAEQAKIPEGRGPARARQDLLPKDLELLQKDNRTDGRDERVHDAVQSIIMATKGLPLTAGDPRLAQIEELTNSKYNDRVRLAAALALAESTDPEIKSRAVGTLRDISLTSEVRALRNDAVKILDTLPAGFTSEGDLEPLREAVYNKLAEAQGKTPEQLQGKSQDEAIAEALQYIATKRNSTDAREKQRAAELLQVLHRWGEGLINTASLKGRGREAADRNQAEGLYRRGLSALGVDEATLTSLAAAAKASEHRPIDDSQAVRDQVTRLIASHQETGAIPALLRGLTGFASVNSIKLNQQGVQAAELANTVDRSIGAASLALALSKAYYPENTMGRGDTLMQVANVYKDISKTRLSLKDRWQQLASNYFNDARTEYTAVKNTRPEILSANNGLNDAHEAFVQAEIERFSTFASRPDRSAYMQRQLNEMSTKLDEEMNKSARKDSSMYALQRFIKAWIDTSALPEDQRAAARQRAETLLNEALTAASRQHGVASPQYDIALQKVWQYHVQQKQPEKAEKFFTDALAAAPPESHRALRLQLLKQAHFFYKQTGNQAKSQEMANAYQFLNRQP